MRTVLHVGATLNWDIHQVDVETAFLHGHLGEEVYMEQPEGGKEPGKESWVCWLDKTLYCLMQAVRGWNQRLHRAMTENGYERISVDHCVYVRTLNLGISIVEIHVDDMCMAASSPEEMKKLKDDLKKTFNLVDLGEICYLLGIMVTWDHIARTISLSQKGYIKKITKWLNLEEAHPISTPLNPNVILSKSLSPDTDHEKSWMRSIPYLTAIGSIMYMAMGMCSDVAFMVQHLSQFSSNPGQAHCTAAQ